MIDRHRRAGLQAFDLKEGSNLRELVQLLEGADMSDLQDAESQYELATIYHSLAMLDEAVTLYKIAMDLDPAHFRARNNLGVCYYEKGLYAKASEQFTQLVDRQPNEAAYYWNLMESLHQCGELEESQKAYDKWVGLTYPDRIRSANE